MSHVCQQSDVRFTMSGWFASVLRAVARLDQGGRRERRGGTASSADAPWGRRNTMQAERSTVEIRSTKRRSNPRGVFEKVPGSGEWWICFWDAQGRKRREKAGTKANAIDLYRKRKTEALTGKKLPEKLRRASATFADIASDALTYSRANKLSYRNDACRMETVLGWFREYPADSITPQDIERRFQQQKDCPQPRLTGTGRSSRSRTGWQFVTAGLKTIRPDSCSTASKITRGSDFSPPMRRRHCGRPSNPSVRNICLSWFSRSTPDFD
jgi:hypothetical protein